MQYPTMQKYPSARIFHIFVKLGVLTAALLLQVTVDAGSN